MKSLLLLFKVAGTTCSSQWRGRSVTAFLLFLACGAAFADVPKKQPLTKYSKLWNDSPFTSKPVINNNALEVNPFEDYTLVGVSSIEGGYRVTLLNKKKPDERVFLESAGTNPEGFKILGVEKKPGDPLGTTVRIGKGSQTGLVAFDSKLLALKAVPQNRGPKPGRNNINGILQNNPNAQPIPGQAPVQDGGNSPIPQRQPRPRIVPPPGANAQGAVIQNGAVIAPPIQNNAVQEADEDGQQQPQHERQSEFRRRR